MEKVYIKKAFDEFKKHAVGNISVDVTCNNYSDKNGSVYWHIYGASKNDPTNEFWAMSNNETFEEALAEWKKIELEKNNNIKTNFAE